MMALALAGGHWEDNWSWGLSRLVAFLDWMGLLLGNANAYLLYDLAVVQKEKCNAMGSL